MSTDEVSRRLANEHHQVAVDAGGIETVYSRNITHPLRWENTFDAESAVQRAYVDGELDNETYIPDRSNDEQFVTTTVDGRDIYGKTGERLQWTQFTASDPLGDVLASALFTPGDPVDTGEYWSFPIEATELDSPQTLKRQFSLDAIRNPSGSGSVRESGLIEKLSYDATVERGGDEHSLNVSWTANAVGSASVSEPSWVSTARTQAPDLEVSRSNDIIEIAHRGGDPLYPGTYLSLIQLGSNSSHIGDVTAELSSDSTLYATVADDGTLALSRSQPSPGQSLDDRLFLTIQNGVPLYQGEL